MEQSEVEKPPGTSFAFTTHYFACQEIKHKLRCRGLNEKTGHNCRATAIFTTSCGNSRWQCRQVRQSEQMLIKSKKLPALTIRQGARQVLGVLKRLFKSSNDLPVQLVIIFLTSIYLTWNEFR